MYHSEELGVLLLLNCPKSLELGIDHTAWHIGSKFKGIKNIPLGVHLVSYNSGVKSTFWLTFTAGTLVQMRIWQPSTEQFTQMSKEQVQSNELSVKHNHYDPYLGPYPQDNYQLWRQSTRMINQQLLRRLLSHTNEEVKEINYTQIPRVFGSNPQAVSKNSIDKTPILMKAIDDSHNLLLGEMQFCFVQFVIGQNQQSLQQWKQLVHLYAFSEEAFLRPSMQVMMENYIAILYEQLSQCPSDFFQDTLCKNNFLVQCLTQIKEYSRDKNMFKKLQRRMIKLVQFVRSKFGFEIQSDDEDQPIVIEQSQSYF